VPESSTTFTSAFAVWSTADCGLGFDLDQSSVGRLGPGESYFSRARLFDYRLMKRTERNERNDHKVVKIGKRGFRRSSFLARIEGQQVASMSEAGRS
jgi:hypothetical protein